MYNAYINQYTQVNRLKTKRQRFADAATRFTDELDEIVALGE